MRLRTTLVSMASSTNHAHSARASGSSRTLEMVSMLRALFEESYGAKLAVPCP